MEGCAAGLTVASQHCWSSSSSSPASSPSWSESCREEEGQKGESEHQRNILTERRRNSGKRQGSPAQVSSPAGST